MNRPPAHHDTKITNSNSDDNGDHEVMAYIFPGRLDDGIIVTIENTSSRTLVLLFFNENKREWRVTLYTIRRVLAYMRIKYLYTYTTTTVFQYKSASKQYIQKGINKRRICVQDEDAREEYVQHFDR